MKKKYYHEIIPTHSDSLNLESRFKFFFVLLFIMCLFLTPQKMYGQQQCCSDIDLGANPLNHVVCDPILHEYSALGPYYIRIYVHVIKSLDGSLGQTDPEVLEALAFLDNAFNEHGIFFVWDCVIDVIENDELAGIFDPYGELNLDDDLDSYSNLNGIDIFLFPDHEDEALMGNFGSGVASGIGYGTSFAIGGMYGYRDDYNNLFVPEGSLARSHTISHEMGHVLGLLHTHNNNATSNGLSTPNEDVDQENNPGQCLLSGDCICDTPAARGLLGQVTPPIEGCLWELASNFPLYEPITNNIMSHTYTSCREELTPGQGQRMRNILAIAEMDEPPSNLSLGLSVLEIPECIVKESITSNTTWTDPIIEIDGIVEVKNGARLIIESNVEVRFPRGSVLRIMPGGTLVLRGTLTNNSCGNACNTTGFGTCGDTWKGVEVWGNSNEHQFTICVDQKDGSTISDIRRQGRFISKQGAVIENAEVAVQLWGPDIVENAGGIIQCTGTTFRNNIVGIDFRPFQNSFPVDVNNNANDDANCDYPVYPLGRKAYYFGAFVGCTFENNSSYPHNTNFEKFIYMEGVDGPRIKGCSFNNDAAPLSVSDISSFGYGIHSIDSEFTLEEKCNTNQAPCNAITRSEFVGLGVGVKVGGYPSSFKPFKIKQTDFTDCFVGIYNRAASNGELLFNDFHMGNIPDFWQTQTQIGIMLNGNITSISLEENEFENEFENPNIRTIGISTTNVGANDLSIRKNSFTGLNIGNEAGGICGTSSADIFNSAGLKYECNDNNENEEYDFLICNTLGLDRIHPNQISLIDNNTGISLVANGNKFSNTASNTDRDFSNQGDDQGLKYYFFDTPKQYPNETAGIPISNKIDAPENFCTSTYCQIPCKTEEEIFGLKNSFYGKRDAFEQAIVAYENAVVEIGEDSYPARLFLERANANKREMLTSSSIILSHLVADLNDWNRDSIRVWLSNKATFESELILGFDYLKTSENAVGLSKLINTINKFDLNETEKTDRELSIELYNILSLETANGLSKEQLSNIETIASSSSTFASGFAKNILEKYGFKFSIEDCENEVGRPDGSLTRNNNHENDSAFEENVEPKLLVYPNPAKEVIYFELQDLLSENRLKTTIVILDVAGKVVNQFSNIESSSKVIWEVSNVPSGIYFYEVIENQISKQRGKLVIQK